MNGGAERDERDEERGTTRAIVVTAAIASAAAHSKMSAAESVAAAAGEARSSQHSHLWRAAVTDVTRHSGLKVSLGGLGWAPNTSSLSWLTSSLGGHPWRNLRL